MSHLDFSCLFKFDFDYSYSNPVTSVLLPFTSVNKLLIITSCVRKGQSDWCMSVRIFVVLRKVRATFTKDIYKRMLF